MKHKSILSVIALIFCVSLVNTSCDDMLTPDLERYATDTYAQDSIYSVYGILKGIQKVTPRTILLDAVRSDLAAMSTYTSDSIKAIANFENPADGSSGLLNVADYYLIINSCNFYLAMVDTVSTVNGSAVMLRETAQVQALRAWTYLQLVRYYGSVPYVTEPIEDSEEAIALEASAPRITADNIADKFIESGMDRALAIQDELGLPTYDDLTNGSITRTSTYVFFPIQLILGDAYLMQHDYEKAAEYYYDYFDEFNTSTNNDIFYCTQTEGRSRNQTANSDEFTSADNWSEAFSSFDSDENIVISIAAVSSSDGGTMMTDLQHVFGFSTENSTSSSVVVEAQEKMQQIVPSEQYITLSEAQQFCNYQDEDGVDVIEYLSGQGDGRLYGTAPYTTFSTRGSNDYTQIIDKYCPGDNHSSATSNLSETFTVSYDVTLYRTPLVWLRFAEAINRMGFPATAFAVLKDGLMYQNFPTLGTHDANVYYVRYDSVYSYETDTLTGDLVETITVTPDSAVIVDGDTLYFSQGYTADSTLYDTPYLSADPVAYTGGIYYMPLDEMVSLSSNSILSNFLTNSDWDDDDLEETASAGIHSRGGGTTGGRQDTIYTYAKQVAKKVAENRARKQGLTYEAQLELEASLYSGDTLLVDDQDEIINAVEDLIVDELAFETAFEGHRFTDLLRIAASKTLAGEDGDAWFAWKMARREYDATSDATEYDAELYTKMLSDTYRYFALPE